MTTSPPTASERPDAPMSRHMRPGLVLLLAGITAVICASVIVTDHFSPRDRGGAVTTLPSAQPASTRVP